MTFVFLIVISGVFFSLSIFAKIMSMTGGIVKEISKRLDRAEKINEDYVRAEYKALKDLIKSDAKHLNLLRNHPDNKNIVQSSFWWGICEASAYGFTAKSNSKIDFTMWSSLEEALL